MVDWIIKLFEQLLHSLDDSFEVYYFFSVFMIFFFVSH